MIRRNENYIIIEDHNLLFAAIPKCANTSIKEALVALLPAGTEIGRSKTGDPLVHRQETVPFTDTADKAVVLARTDCFRFGFVRNPWGRLVSAWHDKCINRPEVLPAFIPFGVYKGMPFAEFVHRVSDVDDEEAEIHFRSQTGFLLHDGALIVDFVGRFERLQKDWVVIQKLFDIGPLEHRTKGSHKPYREYYTPVLRDQVATRYKDDIALFGYTF